MATTQLHVYQGLTVAGVSVDDREIGRAGCNLLMEYLAAEGRSKRELPLWGTHNVLTPQEKYWVNKEEAEKRSISFPQHVLDDASPFTVN